MSEWKEEVERLEAAPNRAAAQKIGVEDITLDRVRVKLPARSALIEFVCAREFDFKNVGKGRVWKPARYVAMILPADVTAPVRLIDLGPAAVIDRAVKQYREQIEKAPGDLRTTTEKDLEAELNKSGTTLYEKIFAPLEKHLGGNSFLYLCPDGELNRLPFEALPDAKGKYLVERYTFAYLTSGRDLASPGPALGQGHGGVRRPRLQPELGGPAGQRKS